MKSNETNRFPGDELIVDDSRTMLPGIMLSLKSDVMDCQVAWCRFATAKSESLERPKHRHVVHEIHYVLDGILNYSFPAFCDCSVEKGHFMLIPGNVLHSTSSGDAGTEYLVIAFSESSGNEAVNAVLSPKAGPFSNRFTLAMEDMISSLKTKMNESNFRQSLSTKLLVHSILLEAIDAVVESLGLEQLYESSAVNADPRVRDIERIVNENKYSQKLRGEDVAAELNLTVRQLNRICNRQFGCSINRYITEIRIESMKELLRNSCYTIRDIATIFGFGDVYTFIRHFTKYAGISPGRYRTHADSGCDNE